MKYIEVQYSGDENRESFAQNSEADSAIDCNRIYDSTDTETTSSSPGKVERFRKPDEKLDSSFASMVADTSTESEIDAQSPVLNKKPATNNFEDLETNSVSSETNMTDMDKPETPESIKKGKFTVKRPRMSKLNFSSVIGNSLPPNVPDIQALDTFLHGFLENKEEEFKDISLDVSDDSIASNTSKGT